MNHRGLFRVDVDSFQKLIDGLDVQPREELTGRLQEEAQQRYLDVCKKFEPWGQADFIHLSKITPPNFFVDIISSYKSRSKLMPPSEDALRVHTELRTKSIGEKRKKINKTCNLNIIPPEVREQIFRVILEDYFAEFPRRSVLVYQNWIMGPCKKINISGNTGLALKDLPAFEIALIPVQKLYREFFALRIKQCTIELRPSITWSHVYSFPPEVQVADPPEEITEWVTDSSKSSFEYMAWVYLQEKELGFHPNIGNSCYNLPLRGWVYRYPSLSKLSPIMLDNIHSVDIILSTDYLGTQYVDDTQRWNEHFAPTFDVLSCNLNYAANLASLSYILSHNTRTFESKFNQVVTLPTTTVLAIILRSLENSLAVETKQSTLDTNPYSLIPAPLSQLTTFSIKTFETKLPSKCCRGIYSQETPTSLRESAEVINSLLAISLESSRIERVPGIGRREIDWGWGVSCYQLVWAAGVGRKLLICEKTESEQSKG
ncbi:uncharacterized protein Bfra_001769 [Botrytis fragariae]|uniref:Uncharacterized protein n=1 Tax=Botrytis fragariae TaxID=1964551 RepID=A0A8H6B1J5_9HELO|nr:uncharacterized protein Bfra_001769 [Botrytis fragariae]KAF5877402.1 hypothetical protein Bfra_001769 [Botrytis fragariae]